MNRKRRRKNIRIELVTITSIDSADGIKGEFNEERNNIEKPRKSFVFFDENEPVALGEKVLVKIMENTDSEINNSQFTGKIIRKINSRPKTLLGVLKLGGKNSVILPINKKDKNKYHVVKNRLNAIDGELVEAEIINRRNKLSGNDVILIKRLTPNKITNFRSSIALEQHYIPQEFFEKVTFEANEVASQKIINPTDLTQVPFISIDPDDARDHDDAIYAELDQQEKDQYNVWVAIADVAKYVLPGSYIDKEAYARGNSTYLPDLVVPMMPKILSSEICSLKQGKRRACIVVKMSINRDGKKISHQFFRAVIKNRFAVSYEEAQRALKPLKVTDKIPRLTQLIQPLYKVYKLIEQQKKLRQPIELELDEPSMSFDKSGNVKSIKMRKRLETHKIVEELMILANTCAAETIENNNLTFLYRVHMPPEFGKLLTLKNLARSLNIKFKSSTTISSKHLNTLLNNGKRKGLSKLISANILRSMSQAQYSPKKAGHFGLNLKTYTHFTSPIRRYSDIVIHRALISIHGWENPHYEAPNQVELNRVGEHLSRMERRSMVAERETRDRHIASFLKNRIGSEFEGNISGLSKSGVFVRLDQTGGDGLIPISSLSHERFILSKSLTKLIGKNSKLTIEVGTKVLVKLLEANSISGGLIFKMIEYDGKPMEELSEGKRKVFKRKIRHKKRIVVA